jgi:hypothetical protein
MRFAIVLELVLFCGNALAQRGPPHAGAVVVGGGGGDLIGFLLVIGGIFVGLLVLMGTLALLGWIMSLLGKLWRRLCEIAR